MSEYSRELIERSGYAGEAFASGYDRYRPSPPKALLDLLCRYAEVERPRLVVDLGSGTGLSARVWADRADEVVGVEANPSMKAKAEELTAAPNVRYIEAFGHETGLPDGGADLVTTSQALHWMEPAPTFAEAARILRAGGIFAAYDYDWPPSVHWEIEEAFLELWQRLGRLRAEPRRHRGPYGKEGHLERMRASGCFRFVRETLVHGVEEATAERIVGFALSLGRLGDLLDEGVTREELALDRVEEVARRTLGDRTVPCHWSYRVRLGVK